MLCGTVYIVCVIPIGHTWTFVWGGDDSPPHDLQSHTWTVVRWPRWCSVFHRSVPELQRTAGACTFHRSETEPPHTAAARGSGVRRRSFLQTHCGHPVSRMGLYLYNIHRTFQPIFSLLPPRGILIIKHQFELFVHIISTLPLTTAFTITLPSIHTVSVYTHYKCVYFYPCKSVTECIGYSRGLINQSMIDWLHVRS